MTSLLRLPSALYVIARTVHDQELAEATLDALHAAGWRLVPGRRPSSRSNEESAPLMVEGQISTQQLVDFAADFDRIDEDLFSAADFIAWLIPEVRGSPEAEWLQRRGLR